MAAGIDPGVDGPLTISFIYSFTMFMLNELNIGLWQTITLNTEIFGILHLFALHL